MNALVTFFGSFAYTGFFPIAPATVACFAYCVIYLFVPGGEWLAHPIVVAATLVLSVPISFRMERIYGHDAGKIVIDEVVGMQVILVFAEPTLIGVVIAFFVFRFFDIIKPPPVNKSQLMPGGWGVVMDDFLAGVYSRIAMIVISLVYKGAGTFL